MLTLTCEMCGKSRDVYPSQVTGPSPRYRLPGGKYFCRSCWDRNKKEMIGLQRPATRKTKICITCIRCGREQFLRPIDADKPNSNVCSICRKAENRPRKHQDSPRRPKDTSPYIVDVVCPDCGVIRQYKRSSASRTSGLCMSCARKGDRSGTYSGGLATIHCSVCGKEKKVRRNRAEYLRIRSTPYKCASCSFASRKGPENSAWKGGVSCAPYPVVWLEELRREVRNRDFNRCLLCGRTGDRLCVHHIDYDKNNCNRSNLISLCKSCHAKTNFDRDSWGWILARKAEEREIL